jgi:asparagine synthetase B (glutamine-hydrolysing)
MKTFALQVDISAGRVVHAAGFDRPIEAEAGTRLTAFTRRQVGERMFFVAGRWYSIDSVEALEAWLARFNAVAVGAWAAEQDGEFQVVVVDPPSRKAYLVSDRNGSWRAYYKNEGGLVSIANRRVEMIGLLTKPAVCPYAVYQLLTLGYVLDPYSLLDGVRAMHPGQMASFDGPRTDVTTYYTPVVLDANYYSSEKECLDGLDEVARGVFGKRLSAARTPVVLLSGGIDSMAMLCYLSELAPGRVRSLTFAHAGMERDERGPALHAARHFGSEHLEFILNPAEGSRRLLQSLAETDTWNYGTLTYLAVRELLADQGGSFDVFTGEDTRLHTPSFDTPRELAIRLSRGGVWRIGRPLAALAGRVFAQMPVSGSLKNYCNYWSRQLRPRADFRSCFVEALLGYDPPVANGRSEHFARLLAEVPTAEPSDRLQEVFKKYVAFEYRAQYTDDMNAMTSCFGTWRTAVHHPFYDWQFVAACNRVPYKLGAKRVFTLKSHSKLPVVQKYVLRQLLRNRLTDDLLYRQKGTNPSLHCFFNRSLRPLVARLLDRWLLGLLERLDDDLRGVITRTIAEFRARQVYVRNHDEPALVKTLAICYVAMLNHLCTHRDTELRDELALFREPAVASPMIWRNTGLTG